MRILSQSMRDHINIYGIDNYRVLELADACDERGDEITRLRDALQFIANHTAEPSTALETVVKFAAATLEGVK